MPFLASEGCFWPLVASMTSEVKNKYAYNIPHDICNKFHEVKFFVGCMVSRLNRLLNILGLLMRYGKLNCLVGSWLQFLNHRTVLDSLSSSSSLECS